MTRINIKLPWPPSTNRNARVGKGQFYIPDEVKQYRHDVWAVWKESKHASLAGEVSVLILAHPPDNRRRDLDNLTQNVLNALKGVAFGDDYTVCHLAITRSYVVNGGYLDVTLAPFVPV